MPLSAYAVRACCSMVLGSADSSSDYMTVEVQKKNKNYASPLHVSPKFCFAFYNSPSGKKVRSKAELARELGDNFDLTMFDFRSGKTVHSSGRKSRRMKGATFDYSRGLT